jgi:hypothetical protein
LCSFHDPFLIRYEGCYSNGNASVKVFVLGIPLGISTARFIVFEPPPKAVGDQDR